MSFPIYIRDPPLFPWLLVLSLFSIVSTLITVSTNAPAQYQTGVKATEQYGVLQRVAGFARNI